jgi:hypothetical protein
MIRAVLIIALLLPLTESASTKQSRSEGERLTVTGTVVAFEQSALRVAKLTFVPRAERLFVRIDKCLKGNEESRYITVLYTYLGDEAALPDEVFDASKRRRFTLTRNRSCDGSLPQKAESKDSAAETNTGVQLPQLQRTRGAEAEDIPTDSSLPCYALRPRDFRSAEGRK